MESWNNLRILCKDRSVILQRLGARGILTLNDLSEVTEEDILDLDLQDFVVRRRLITWLNLFPAPAKKWITLSSLCNNHTRTLRKLKKHGINSLEDVEELQTQDIYDLKLLHMVSFRRLIKRIECPGEMKVSRMPDITLHFGKRRSRLTVKATSVRRARSVGSPSRHLDVMPTILDAPQKNSARTHLYKRQKTRRTQQRIGSLPEKFNWNELGKVSRHET